MAEGLFIVDARGQVVFINSAAERITGYRRQGALVQNLLWPRDLDRGLSRPPKTRELSYLQRRR